MADDQKILQVGYIGMGIMGSAMAANLLKAGFAVTVWNRTATKCNGVVALGAKRADSIAAIVAGGAEVICVNVTDTPDVEAVLFGSGGIVENLARRPAGAPKLIVVDHSTIDPVATGEFAKRLAGHGATLLDAPVSGGDVGARNGTLSIMVGGDAVAFERCTPVFSAMGKSIRHLGDSGMGQACKACNQVLVAVTLMGVCEAMALAKKSGLDVNKMIEVCGGGAAASWQLANLGPRIAGGDHKPGFMIDLVLKDLGIVESAAKQLGVPLEAVAKAREEFQFVQQQGGGRLGTQAMAKYIESRGGIKFGG